MDMKLFAELLSQPTAPFRENHVKKVLKRYLSQKDVPHFDDPAGNIVVGVNSHAEYVSLLNQPSDEPVRLFIAHMDHPGFLTTEWVKKGELKANWYGRGPIKHLVGAPVWLADETGYCGSGKIAKLKFRKDKKAIESSSIIVDKTRRALSVDAASMFGGFKFRAPYWKSGKLVYTKAADDLVGAFTIATVAAECKGANFLAILTRAEEVGWVGATHHFDLGWWVQRRRPLLCVSLEASRTIPGALIGAGPVVRLGDYATPFDAGSLQVLSRLALKVLPGKHQRKLMDGGSCEGTVAMAHQLPTIGLSIPLGNYHNQSFEGGPGSRGKLGPAPEFVHLDDVKGMGELCRAILQPGLPWQSPWQHWREDMKEIRKRYEALMQS